MDTSVMDFTKEQQELYLPKAEPIVVSVPEMQFLMIDGKGAPDPERGSSEDINEFQRAISVLYGLVYSIKMSPRKGVAPPNYYNFKVPPLEALWWMADGSDFDVAKPDRWRWTLMMRVPEYVTPDILMHFADELAQKKKNDVYRCVRMERYSEGPSVQLMHTGSYVDEGPNIAKMHAFAARWQYRLHGKHHEIYYGDPRRVAPEKLKTVLRHPIQK